MRTATYLLAAVQMLTASCLTARAEVAPTNASQVTVGVAGGVKVTNIVAQGTSAPTTNVTTQPLLLTVPAYEGMERLEILTSANVTGPWTTNASSATTNTPGRNNLVGYDWSSTTSGSKSFQRAVITPISSNKLLTAIALNRLAYGPTPYELVQLLGTNADGIIGGPGATGATKTADQWIDEQLRPWDFSAAEDVTNQFSGYASLSDRFSGRGVVILSNAYAGPTEVTGPGTMGFNNYKDWYLKRCIGARRQFLEVMLYWLENHFVSQWTKSYQTFEIRFQRQENQIPDRVPTAFETREHNDYRNALHNPACTWADLLRIQHESESMITYLDTRASRGAGTDVANENYAREILELYCMGVDNGYDQRDITALSAVWTGWGVEKVRSDQAYLSNGVPVIGLYASETNAYRLTSNDTSNKENSGVYTIQFRPSFHCNSNIYAFYLTTNDIAGARGNSYNNNYPNGPVIPGPAGFKYVESRFNGSGMNPPYNYANKLYGTNTTPGSYALYIPATSEGSLANANTNAARTNKAYTVMNHIANLPYTQEFISVKLCRLLVHDNFGFGATGYDFSDNVVTPEEQLVWDCMMAWENPPGGGPKGQIWKVLRTITDSKLFRSQAAQGSKIKSPLEYCVSALRALRFSTNGTFNPNSFTVAVNTSSLDRRADPIFEGISVAFGRMGSYLLFDRETPDGYPETGTAYVGAGALIERARWIHTILDDDQEDALDGSPNRLSPIQLLFEFVPAAKQNDADTVARFFLSCLFPGEGEANLDYYRRRAIDILDTNLAGNYSAGSFANQTIDTQNYDFRIRRMVAFLLTTPAFHEQ